MKSVDERPREKAGPLAQNLVRERVDRTIMQVERLTVDARLARKGRHADPLVIDVAEELEERRADRLLGARDPLVLAIHPIGAPRLKSARCPHCVLPFRQFFDFPETVEQHARIV